MALIPVACGRCGTRVEVDEGLAGQTLHCISCNSAMRIPAPGESSAPAAPPASIPVPAPVPDAPAAQTAGTPPAQTALRISGRDGRSRLCVRCGSAMDNADIVCTACGYNTQTGRSPGDRMRRRQNIGRILTFVAMTGILGGGAVWVLKSDRMPRSAPEPAAAPPPVEMPVETPAPPPDPAVEAAIRKQIADGLDREAPPYIIGQMMQIETRRGRVLTGTLQRIGPEDVFVTNSEGQTLSARLSELNNASRWSVDSSARAEEIERRLKAKMSF